MKKQILTKTLFEGWDTEDLIEHHKFLNREMFTRAKSESAIKGLNLIESVLRDRGLIEV